MVEQHQVGTRLGNPLPNFLGLALADEIFWFGYMPAAGGGVQDFRTGRRNQFDEFGQVFPPVFITGIHVDKDGAIAQFGTFKQGRLPEVDSRKFSRDSTLNIQKVRTHS
jgi:hypothetical protein